MKVVILGAGAIGTILAGHLARAGHEVSLIARGKRAGDLESQGVRIAGINSFQTNCQIVREPQLLTNTDLFINTVKTYDSASALSALSGIKPKLTFSVQNGVAKEAELCARFGNDAVIGAMADFSGEVCDDGSVLFTRNVNLHLGELDGAMSERVVQLAAAIQAAGINARAIDNVKTVIWSKYTGWLSLLLLSVLTRQYTGDYLRDPATAQVAVDIIRECAQLPAALGIPLISLSPVPVPRVMAGSAADGCAVVQETGATMHAQAPTHRLSGLQDLLRGRKLELEETVGYALREARARGIAMPVTETCYRIASAINRTLG